MAGRLRGGPRTAWHGLAWIGLAATSAVAPGRATASPDAIPIEWTAPPGCPSAEHVDAAVDRLLGGAPVAAGRRLRVRGTVTPRDAGFDLALETETEGGSRGRRALSGVTCEALADAAALVVALGWDPAAVAAARAEPRDVAPPAPAATTPASSVAPPAAPPPAAPPPSAWAPPPAPPRPPGAGAADIAEDDASVGVGLGVLLEAGGLPGVSTGFTGWAALLAGAYRLEIGATGIPSAEAALEGDEARGGRFGQVLGSATVCRAVAPWEGGGAGHELAACLGVEGGAVFATGFGVDREREATVPWIAPRGGASARLALGGGLAVRADLVLAVPLVRDTFFLEELGEIHRPAPLAGRLVAGLDLRF